METPSRLTLPLVVISVLAVCGPTEAWYKQMSGPSYYSVGRASGLLSGIRRSPYVRRDEPQPTDSEESAGNSILSDFTLHSPMVKTMPVCIKDVTPDLQSCELFQEVKGSFRCKAEVFLSLDSSDCAGD